MPPQALTGGRTKQGVLVGDLVRFLRSLVEANQTAVLAMEDHDGPEMPPPIIVNAWGGKDPDPETAA